MLPHLFAIWGSSIWISFFSTFDVYIHCTRLLFISSSCILLCSYRIYCNDAERQSIQQKNWRKLKHKWIILKSERKKNGNICCSLIRISVNICVYELDVFFFRSHAYIFYWNGNGQKITCTTIIHALFSVSFDFRFEVFIMVGCCPNGKAKKINKIHNK